MSASKWSKHEAAVVVYFASRNADHEACSKILGLKCSAPRTAFAIRKKLAQIRADNVSLWDQKSGWDRDKVD